MTWRDRSYGTYREDGVGLFAFSFEYEYGCDCDENRHGNGYEPGALADECECGNGGLSRLNAGRDGEQGVGGGIIGAGRMKNRLGCGILDGVDIHRVTSSAGFSLTGDDNFGSVGRNGKSHGV